jgi:hypothetical protein
MLQIGFGGRAACDNLLNDYAILDAFGRPVPIRSVPQRANGNPQPGTLEFAFGDQMI